MAVKTIVALFLTLFFVSIYSRELYFGYFGFDDTEAALTADHVNLALLPGWGPPGYRDIISERILSQMQQCKDKGIPWVSVALDHILYTYSGSKATYNGDGVVVPLVIAFFDEMVKRNLTSLVKSFYPIDEPDVGGVPASAVFSANSVIRNVASHYRYLDNATLGVIYGDRKNYPGIESYDWVGFDNYGAREGIFNSGGMYSYLLSRLKPNQKTIIVPGGANPWKQDPARFVQQALNDPRVAWLCPFLWVSSPPGNGIQDNGMAATYRSAGRQILAANNN